MHRQNDAVQGLRGIAALLVVITHAVLTLARRSDSIVTGSILAVDLGILGVKMFFMISGFIMTATMYESYARPGALLSFVLKRLIRIVPLYWLASAVYMAKLAMEGYPPPLSNAIFSFAFIPYRNYSGMIAPEYGLGWTLNYEIFFYLLFAITLPLKKSLGIPLLLMILCGLALLNLTIGPFHCTEWSCDAVSFYTNPIVLYFAGGVLLAIARLWGNRNNGLKFFTPSFAVIAAAALTLLYGFIASEFDRRSLMALAPLLVCTSVAFCAFSNTQTERSRLTVLFLSLGDASYSIYLTHSFLIGPSSRIWARFFGEQGLSLFVLGMLIGSAILGVFVYRLIERPLLHWLRSWLHGERSLAVSLAEK